MRPHLRPVLLAALLSALPVAVEAADEFRVYTAHPRLFLGPQRLRLLRRERERQSIRWRQFEALMQGRAAMPEPGFAFALYAAAAEDAASARKAVEWALGAASDLRQMALVYDWCQDQMTAAQASALRTRIAKLAVAPAGPPGADRLPRMRDRILAAIATADDGQHSEEPALRNLMEGWFRDRFAPALLEGAETVAPPDTYALLEILHAVRDNLNLDAREWAGSYFKRLPEYQVLANYPAPYQGPENEFRIPVYTAAGQPDLNQAALSRAGGLSMVAYDHNAQETQFLQGWLIQDRFLMRGVFGAPYEFLWANPYQPGLSFFHLPTVFHDARSGALFVRSSWEEDALWFGLIAGRRGLEAQLFRDGRISVLNSLTAGAADPEPIRIGAASVLAGRDPLRFTVDSPTLFVVGLKPRRPYLVEVDDEELDQADADAAGTVTLEFPPERKAGARMRESRIGNTGT